MRDKRPRLTKSRSETNKDEYSDGYQSNAASKNAKFLCYINELSVLELWIDKHYSNRRNFGDENGRRHGIEEFQVEELIKKSLKHLFYYSFKHNNFSFMNFPPPLIRNKRIVLKDSELGKEDLNVVVEYQFLELNKYEVTAITAMRKNDFLISDNQFCIHFEGDSSILFINRNKKLIEIDTF